MNESVNEVYTGEGTGILEQEEQDSARQGSKHWLYKSSIMAISQVPKTEFNKHLENKQRDTPRIKLI